MQHKPTDKELNHIVLNEYVRFDNTLFQFTENINSVDYPEQNMEMIKKEIPLWYLDERGNEKKRGLFTVIRWDLEDPNRVILVNDKMNMVLVSSTKHVIEDGTEQKDYETDLPVANAFVHHYPIQNEDLLGVNTIDRYMKDQNTNRGIIIRADYGFGGIGAEFVILEILNGTKEIQPRGNQNPIYRLVTLAEVKAVCQYTDIHPRFNRRFTSHKWWPENWRLIYEKENA